MARKPRLFILMLAALLVSQLGYGVWTPSYLTNVHAAGSAGPQLIGKSPADNAELVAANANLVLTFDEAVTRGTGSAAVTIRRVSDNSVFETFEIATSNRVTIANGAPNVVTIDPIQDMVAGTQYYVLIDAGAFRGPTDINYAGIASATEWNFSVGTTDTAAPALSSTSVSVHSGIPFTMTFNEPVFAASGTITIANISDTSDVQVLNVVSPSITGSGSATISVLPPLSLRPGSSYTVTVARGAFQDGAGNSFAGTNWRLTVNSPPIPILGLEPADESSGIDTNRVIPLVLTLSQNVVKGDMNRYVEIRKIADNSIFQRIRLDSGAIQVSGNKVTITPSYTFAANTGYYVLIEADAFRDSATSRESFQGITDASTWNFTTAPAIDNVRPTLIERKPADNAVEPSLRFPLELTFSEPVYPGNGNIVIKNAHNDLPVETIPVTSTQVVGGGTTVIKVTPTVSFVNNGSYYVQIGNAAFRDAAGNTYAGILDTDKTSWNFSTAQDNAVPTITSFSPAPGSNNVPTNGSFTLTFSEPIIVIADNILLRRTSGSSSQVATTAAVDPDDHNKLIITPRTALSRSATYYMEIPAGSLQDLSGNDFGGILNENTYRFGTIGSDSTAPRLSSATMSGSTKIVLNYNEPLQSDAGFVPVSGSFYVTVNDAYRAVTTVAVEGEKVTLTLQSGVISGQSVKVYYTQPSDTRAIQDLSGNKASSISGHTVTNAPSHTVPAPVSASVNGSVVTVVFNDTLQQLHNNAYSQFAITVNGYSYTASSAVSNGSTLLLTFGTSITSGQQVVAVNYTPGSYPLRDTSGNLVSAFNGFPVKNALDTTAPVIQSAIAVGNTITLTFNEPLDTGSKPGNNQFYVIAGSTSRNVTAVTINSSHVVLTLSLAVSSGQTVSVGYIGGSPALKDAAGNSAAAFSNYPATNNTPATGSGSSGTGTSMALTSVVARGTEITLSFNQPVRTTNPPVSSQFVVRANGTMRTVSNISISGSTTTLTVSPSIEPGDRVTLTYVASSSMGLASAGGESVATFYDYVVSNLTTGLERLSGELENADGGGVAMKAGSAAATSGRSSSGDYVLRYIVNGDKLSTAFSAVKLAFPNNPRVIFPVPSTESAAVVDVPLPQLENAARLDENAVFGIAYKDMTFEIPLSALDFASIRQLGGSGNQYLRIEADSGADSQTADLRSMLSAKKMQAIGSPMHFHVYVSNGVTANEITEFKGYLTRTLKTSTQLTESATAVVWLDPETGILSYVPTSIVRRNNETIITFRRMGNSAYALVRGNFSFNDIKSSHWARADMLMLLNKFIVEGRTSTAFEPDKPITRGEFAAYIARGLGLAGDREAAKKFTDVSNSTVMAAYIGAASNAGIITGISANKFQPNSAITREQMAAMMVRAARFAGKEIELNRTAAEYLRPYKDNASVSSWARTDAAKAIEAGIINGMSPTSFSPKSNATRAQAVVMIKRMLGYLDFI